VEEEVSVVDGAVSGAEDSHLGAVTAAVTGAVDEVTPLTRTKEVLLQTRDPPRAMDWAMVSLVPELRRGLSFLAIKTESFFFPFCFIHRFPFLFSFSFFGELRWNFSPCFFLTAQLTKRYPAFRLV
jgi:hypothetical protein